MIQFPHGSSETIYRRALIISDIHGVIDSEQRKKESQIVHSIFNTTARIYKSIDKLWYATKTKPPYVNFKPATSKTKEADLIPVFEVESRRSKSYRVLVGLKDLKDEQTDPDFRETKEISHLVNVKFEEPFGWRGSDGIAFSTVNTTKENLPYLIEDIALDISMFYAYL